MRCESVGMVPGIRAAHGKTLPHMCRNFGSEDANAGKAAAKAELRRRMQLNEV